MHFNNDRHLFNIATLHFNKLLHYTGVDPKQWWGIMGRSLGGSLWDRWGITGDHWGITGNLEGGKPHLATRGSLRGHWGITAGSLGDHWGITGG